LPGLRGHLHFGPGAIDRDDHSRCLVLDLVVGAAAAVARVDSTVVVRIDVEVDPGDVGGDDVELEGRATAGPKSCETLITFPGNTVSPVPPGVVILRSLIVKPLPVVVERAQILMALGS
jgi:hypothetical protein